LINLFRYRTPRKYATEFGEVSSVTNIRQVRILATTFLLISTAIRLASLFFQKDLAEVPNFNEYNFSNFFQMTGSFIFLLLSSFAMKSYQWRRKQRDLLVTAFALFILTSTFLVSYIYSQHNTKNTLTVFLIGIVVITLFFSLEINRITLLSAYVTALFITGMVLPGELAVGEQVFNVVAAVILASVLFICARYSYYFKSEHFIQLKQLQEKNAEIFKLNQQKSEILSFVAHDLRAPLNNIEALSNLMIGEKGEDPDHQPLEMILNSAVQAKNIINDLIEVIQEERQPIIVTRTNMVTYLKSCCSTWEANTGQARRIRLTTEKQPLFACINDSKFSRVLDNLITNGLKFSPVDKPMEITASVKDNRCIIEVSDQGIGIPDHLQDKVFDQFSKAGRPGLKGESSLGLGLHISRNIIREHGGDLTLKSKENEGTTFTISLPLSLA